MLTLDAALRIPDYVMFNTDNEDIVLLNPRTDQYYALEEVGARLWGLLKDGKPLREIYQALLDEYEVAPIQLEQDMLELLNHLLENGLVESVQG
jgi:hypothetical protein